MSILIVLATFLAAGVEWVEALTIVLAVGLFKGWRSAFAGTIIALAALAALVLGFGYAVTAHVNIDAARTVVGVFLLLFGLKWLHKAILRSSGVLSLHDEAKAFAKTREMLVGSSGGSATAATLDRVGVSTAFGGVFLEGLEVVFIVVALGGLRSVPAAVVGAAASLVVVVALGFALRHPLTQVPENTMKYVVGIMLTSFGTFFAGEGIGVQWWRSDLSLLPLIVAYGLASILFVQFLKHPPRLDSIENGVVRSVRGAFLEVWGLFVGDGALAIMAIAILFGTAVFVEHNAGNGIASAILLFAGVLLSIAVGIAGALKERPAPPTPSIEGGATPNGSTEKAEKARTVSRPA